MASRKEYAEHLRQVNGAMRLPTDPVEEFSRKLEGHIERYKNGDEKAVQDAENRILSLFERARRNGFIEDLEANAVRAAIELGIISRANSLGLAKHALAVYGANDDKYADR